MLIGQAVGDGSSTVYDSIPDNLRLGERIRWGKKQEVRQRSLKQVKLGCFWPVIPLCSWCCRFGASLLDWQRIPTCVSRVSRVFRMLLYSWFRLLLHMYQYQFDWPSQVEANWSIPTFCREPSIDIAPGI
jgi:hypothetical protein